MTLSRSRSVSPRENVSWFPHHIDLLHPQTATDEERRLLHSLVRSPISTAPTEKVVSSRRRHFIVDPTARRCLDLQAPDTKTPTMALDRHQPNVEGRPGLYVHVELGLTWRTLKTRHLTYMSKGLRPRRRVPPNTNFLADDHSCDSHDRCACSCHNHRQYYHYYHHARAIPAASVTMQEQEPPMTRLAVPQALRPGQEQSRSRSRSRSTRSSTAGIYRGNSAPPPFNDSPWDADPEPMTATALPRRRSPPRLYKALPAIPSQRRLGEDEMPWTVASSPFPVSPDCTINEGQHGAYFDDRARGRALEMQSLAAALITVDNGFEDQWWYQGQRPIETGLP